MKFKAAALAAILGMPFTFAACSTAGVGGASGHRMEGQCSPGITDTEIRIGSSIPLSGPLGAFGTGLRGSEAYLASVNAAGGVTSADGKTRKISLTLKDDAYDPARTVQNVRDLVERDQVFALYAVLGTSNVLAANDYLQDRGVPQIYVNTGAPEIRETGNPNLFGWNVPFELEAQTVVAAVTKRNPNAKVGMLYPANGFGEAIREAFEAAFEATGGAKITASQSYDSAATSVDSQVVALKNSGADVFLNYTLGAFTPAAMRKAHELEWGALQVISNSSNQLASSILPAGKEASVGVLSLMYAKDSNDVQWENDPGLQAARETLAEYAPSLDRDHEQTPYLGVLQGQLLVDTLERMKGCTYDDLMASVRTTDGFQSGILLPNVEIRTTPSGLPAAVTQSRIGTFNGESWEIEDAVYSPLSK